MVDGDNNNDDMNDVICRHISLSAGYKYIAELLLDRYINVMIECKL